MIMTSLVHIVAFLTFSVISSFHLNGKLHFRKKTEVEMANVPESSKILETSKFIDITRAQAIKNSFGSPVYVYDEKSLKHQAEEALNFPNSFGLKVR